MRHLSPMQLKEYLNQARVAPFLLDVREPWEYQVCRLEGAQLLPMRQIPTSYQTLDKNRETVVICHHGVRSYQVAYFLEHMGFTNVINLTGGVAAWARDVDPAMPVY
ncbi:Rhodanese-related sulfurtransferase [Gammaproteobacteria bacterium]